MLVVCTVIYWAFLWQEMCDVRGKGARPLPYSEGACVLIAPGLSTSFVVKNSTPIYSPEFPNLDDRLVSPPYFWGRVCEQIRVGQACRCLPENDIPAGGGNVGDCVSSVPDCPKAIQVFV